VSQNMVNPPPIVDYSSNGAGESSIDSTYPPAAVRNGRLAHFVALPSDGSTPLTAEQLDALFPPDNVPTFIRDVARLAREAADDA
jgi:hypothetical protein